MVAEKLDYLKQVDFKLFITLLRLVLSLYHLNIWIRDEVSDFFRNFPSSVTALPSFPLPGDCPVDTSKLRAYLQR